MTIEEFQAKVGQELGKSEWVEIDQAKINQFADTTEDHQFIHVDEERAKMVFGSTIAHGFLTLSLLVPMAASLGAMPEAKMVVNAGFNKVRFLSPVRSGKKVRGIFTLAELTEKKPGQWQQVLDVSVEIEGEEKPALIAEWIMQVYP